uniref:(northern house mosquito) hypothetical protein n=1 Tax=Culex pipiens TaxID=7175 RepID=A0A8D8DUV6_CULPI
MQQDIFHQIRGLDNSRHIIPAILADLAVELLCVLDVQPAKVVPRSDWSHRRHVVQSPSSRCQPRRPVVNTCGVRGHVTVGAHHVVVTVTTGLWRRLWWQPARTRPKEATRRS